MTGARFNIGKCDTRSMQEPGSSGMEPVFGEAYGTNGLSCPKGVVVMLGAPALSLSLSLCRGQQPGCELLSDLLEDVITDDTHTSERCWDVSALDDITHYAKGSPEGAPPSCESSSVSPEGDREEPWLSLRPRGRQPRSPTDLTPCVGLGAGHLPLAGRDPESWSEEAGGRESEAGEDLQQVGQEEAVLNYSLQSEPDTESSQGTDSDIGEEEEEKEEEDGKEEEENGRETMEEEKGKEEEELQSHVRPKKRRRYWECSLFSDLGRDGEKDRERDEERDEVKYEGDIIWGPSTLLSTMCLKEGTSTNDASDLTPSPGKLQSLGEQLHTLSSALEDMTPVSDLPVTARTPTRKERNKLASRSMEYDGLLGAVLQIKELIRQRVENREEDTERGSLRERLEDILKESAGPRVAGRGKAFVERILTNAAGKSTREIKGEGGSSDPSH
ncbi:unnamed protein product [Coregonus sp. 'balchen']|nr:unnamed protein product [Coregonus sp. 'balchen']